MALFQILFAFVVSSTCMAATFDVRNPALQAETVLSSNSWWHLGGFCFGQDHGAPVARLAVRMRWSGQEPLDDSARVYLAAFDGREDRWGAAKHDWETSSCEQKMAVATDAYSLPDMAGGGLKPQVDAAFAVNIRQKTATRDWHYALLVCGNVEAARLNLMVEAEDGALSTFGANQNFDNSSCPVMPVSWWQHAAEDPLFWLVLLIAASMSTCVTIWVLHFCKMRWRKQAKVSSDPRSRAELNDVVVGKPCEEAAGEITDGHINSMQKTLQDANVPKEV